MVSRAHEPPRETGVRGSPFRYLDLVLVLAWDSLHVAAQSCASVLSRWVRLALHADAISRVLGGSMC